jgi:hypothetical protein
MPRRRLELVVLSQRIAAAQRIIADQQVLIAKLKAAGQPSIEAESALRSYLSSLRHLEDRARKIRAKGK